MGDDVESRACGKPCPIDGGASDWSDWGTCMKNAEGLDEQRRTRTCTNPEPRNSGKSCTEEMLQKRSCNSNEPIEETANTVVTVLTQETNNNIYLILLLIVVLALGGYAMFGPSKKPGAVGGGFVNASCSQFVNYPTL